LKDLRETGSSSNSIKRFFESATAKDQSPRKKRKLSYDDPSDFNPVDEMNEHPEMEAMPGFHEDDETDLRMMEVELDEIDHVSMSRPVSAVNPPPPSVSNGQASSSKQPPPRETHEIDTRKPLSKRKAVTHDCPVCCKTLETDNEGLNAHIDFCLSRGAIMEAQVEASQSSASTKGNKYKGWPKPQSKKISEIKAPASKGKPPGKRGK